jgi:hypothetical protein
MAHFSPRSFISRRWWTRYRRGRFGLDGAAEPDELAGAEEDAAEDLLGVPEVAVSALFAVGVAAGSGARRARWERATWVPVWWPGSCSWPVGSLVRSTRLDALDSF